MDEYVRVRLEAFIRKSLEQDMPRHEILQKLKRIKVHDDIAAYLIKRVELENYFIYDENKLLEEQKRIEKAQEEFRKGGSLRVKDIMSFPVHSIAEDASILEAVRRMAEQNIGSLVVLEKEKPIGLISERDLLIKVLAKNIDYRAMKVKDIMTAPIICADIKERLIEVETKMKVHNVRRIPITDGDKLVGIITTTDIVRLMAFL